MAAPTLKEICYLAGIIDGEGYIGIQYWTHRNRKGLRIQIKVTDAGLIEWISNRFPGKTYVEPAAKPHRKKCYVINWYGKNAKALLKRVLPYLIIKRQQAEIAVGWPLPPLKVGEEVPHWARKKRDDIHRELQRLNKRGSPKLTEVSVQA